MGREAQGLMKKIAERMELTSGQRYSDCMGFMRRDSDLNCSKQLSSLLGATGVEKGIIWKNVVPNLMEWISILSLFHKIYL